MRLVCEVSVLICTRNRAVSLRETLASIAAMNPGAVAAWEVVVVDNGSTDQTQTVLRDFANRLPLRVVTEARPGLAVARNSGLRAARGEIILFTDDDCVVAPDWMATGARLLASDPMRLIGGRVELHDPRDLPLGVKTTPTREELTAPSGLFGFLHGANLGFGRGVPERVGLFDVRFGAGARLRAAEDTEMVYRTWRAGLPVSYEPELLVYHDHGRRGLRTWFSQTRGYAYGDGAMAAKHALGGDYALLKSLYWDLHSTLRGCRADRRNWKRLPPKAWALPGALRYLLLRNDTPT